MPKVYLYILVYMLENPSALQMSRLWSSLKSVVTGAARVEEMAVAASSQAALAITRHPTVACTKQWQLS